MADQPSESARQAERFRAVFDQAAIGMAALTVDGRVVRANDALHRLLGVRNGLVGAEYHDLLSAGADDIRRAIDVVASDAEELVAVEHRRWDGERWLLGTFTAVRDGEVRPRYLFLQVQDITARRNAEQQLRESEERFRLLVDSVADYAIFMLDPAGHITSWNLGAQRTNGYTADEVLGEHFRIFYTEEAKARQHPEYELEVAAAEGRYEEEGLRVRKDGTEFFANVVISAMRDDRGELRGFAKVMRDVTERRAANELLAKVAAERTQFLAITAHELRTPVTVVNGFASALRDHWNELGDKERGDMIAALSRGGQRLSRLVDELLTASRLEAGALEVHSTPFDLGELVREIVGEVTATTGFPVDVEAGDDVVFADRGRVQQMLANYVNNAVRHGEPPVTVRTTRVDGSVEIRVSDSGTGVPIELVPKLFGKFVRGANDQGTGLGLFIVRELARAQGGDAWYEHRPTGGATFALRLPSAR